MLKHLYYAAGSAVARATVRRPVGRSIYDGDWDICIVLDSCRVDALRARWLGTLTPECFDSVWSRGSITTEWLAQTFRPTRSDAIADTTLVTANPHSATVFGDRDILTNQETVGVPYPDARCVGYDAFHEVHELWRTHATAQSAVPPDVMADATIQAHRDTDGRVVAHWLQPHEPFLAPDAPLDGGAPTSRNVWDGVMAGDLDASAVIESYLKTLDLALFELATVLRSVDARVLVTADHGNAFGEWGIWGHPAFFPQPQVRKVPWVIVAAEQRRAYNPNPVLESTAAGAAVSDQLKALGYR